MVWRSIKPLTGANLYDAFEEKRKFLPNGQEAVNEFVKVRQGRRTAQTLVSRGQEILKQAQRDGLQLSAEAYVRVTPEGGLELVDPASEAIHRALHRRDAIYRVG